MVEEGKDMVKEERESPEEDHNYNDMSLRFGC